MTTSEKKRVACETILRNPELYQRDFRNRSIVSAVGWLLFLIVWCALLWTCLTHPSDNHVAVGGVSIGMSILSFAMVVWNMKRVVAPALSVLIATIQDETQS